jgi:hypothetical protein
MSLIKDLFETPHNLSTGSKYTAVNGVLYFGDRSSTGCVAGRNTNAFQGRSFRWARGSSDPCDWSDGCGHRLALSCSVVVPAQGKSLPLL